mmetsp:Transcript_79361/g.256531  ORF Transcript_79361/g.256531 Transcript_79361/m.256531 type:complete len:121 (-) Transcript_79361:2-364(-)
MTLDDIGREAQFAKSVLLAVWHSMDKPVQALPGLRPSLHRLAAGGRWPPSFGALGGLLEAVAEDTGAAFGAQSEEATFARRMVEEPGRNVTHQLTMQVQGALARLTLIVDAFSCKGTCAL